MTKATLSPLPPAPAVAPPIRLGSSLSTSPFGITNAFQVVPSLSVPVNVPANTDVKITLSLPVMYAGTTGGGITVEIFEDAIQIDSLLITPAASASWSDTVVVNRTMASGLVAGPHTYSIQVLGPATGGPQIFGGTNFLGAGINGYPAMIVEAVT